MSGQAPDVSRLRIDRGEPAPAAPRGRRVWPYALLVVLLLVGLGWYFLPGLLGPTRVVTGRVTRVGGAQAASGVSANGYVVARKQAALSTDIQGRIVELAVEEGDRVEEGALIARLDTSQLEASLQRARSDFERSQANSRWAGIEHQRLEPLLVDGIASRNDVDEARAARDAAAAEVAALAAQVSEIEVMIHKSSVFAPFAGVITRKNAEVGEVVSAIGATGPNARGSVATLVDFATLEVQVELAQTSLEFVSEGAPALIYLDAAPEEGYQGRVRQIWPTADRTKGTVELRVVFADRDERVLPEMGVRVVFVPEESKDPQPVRVLMPGRAVVDGSAVFLVQDGRAVRREITLAAEDSPSPAGASGEGLREVAGGLSGGETVVLDPPAALQDGDEVEVEGTS